MKYKRGIFLRRDVVAVFIGTLLFGSVFLFLGLVKGASNDIVITEIGAYEAGDHEWVEIYNKGTDAINISGWKFLREGESNHEINTTTLEQTFEIAAGAYAIIAENDVNFRTQYPDVVVPIFDSSWGSINEDGSKKIGFKDGDGVIIEFFNYPAAPDFSLERIDVDVLATEETNWKEHPDSNSVGEQNYWMGTGNDPEPEENQVPVAVITATSTATVGEDVSFSAEQSNDADGTIAEYEWLFNDVVVSDDMSFKHVFSTTGTVDIVLSVTDDDGAVASTTAEIVIADTSGDNGTDEPPDDEPTAATTSYSVLINEFVSDPVAGENEWIELYNHTSTTVDLTDWALHEGYNTSTKKLKTLDGAISAYGYMVVNLTSSKLNNSGDLIVLFDAEQNEVDRIAYGDWDDGDTTDNAPKTDDPNGVARIVVGQDTNNDKNDFAITTTLTPSEENVITAPEVENPQTGGGGGGGSPITPITQPEQTKSYTARDVVINELVSDPSDEFEEFIELYNTTNEIIQLDDWWIEDGSEAKTNLSGNISAHGFVVIEKPKGNLNNSGDMVVLFDPSGKEIDSVTYGTWDDGNVADNAPAPEDPLSLIRKVDGQDSDNDYYDFVLTSTITSGKANVISQVTKDGEVIEQLIDKSTIEISEILPNPKGSDSEDEFIELFNAGSETIDISGWKLGDASSKRYTIKQGSLQPGDYMVFKRSMTGIALNNTGGDEVKLFSAQDQLLDSVTYVGSAGEDMSYVRDEAGNWVWTTDVTAGKKNIVKGTSAAPIIAIDVDTEVSVGQSIIFDASDTTDADGDEIHFVWDFGNGDSDTGSVVEYVFEEEGVYTVTLEAVDSADNSAKKEIIITVKSISDYVSGYSGGDDVRAIIISEILPNPEGSDTTEFIELYNPTDSDIDLTDLKLDDEEGGSRAYKFPDKTIILSHEYKVFGRQETGLALNNTTDAVRLLYPDGTVIAEVRYDDVLEAHSYVKNDEGLWGWTSIITAGEKNIIEAPTAVKGTKISKKSTYVKTTINATLATLRGNDVGDSVKVTGVVAVEPGILGTQYFYITDSSSTTPSGVQVYMYSKDFPKIETGDRVEVTGELSETSGEVRIKTKEKRDIVKIDHAGIPDAMQVDIVDIGEPFEGALVQVNGEITELKGSYMYVDDGTEEVKVYFKRGAGIKKEVLQEGDIVTVAGLVHQTKSGYQLLPRNQYDILKTGVAEEYIRQVEQNEQADSADLAEKYLTATAGGLTAIFVGLFSKSHGGKLAGLLGRLFKFKKREEE